MGKHKAAGAKLKEACANATAEGRAEALVEKKYNGWTNYETWNVALWIDNEEGSYRYWRGLAQECYDEARNTPSVTAKLTGREPFTHEELATLVLSRRLENEIKEGAPELGASMYSDLTSAALSEVNWYEIASHWIEEVDKTEDNAE